jgi:hypothetical protein
MVLGICVVGSTVGSLLRLWTPKSSGKQRIQIHFWRARHMSCPVTILNTKEARATEDIEMVTHLTNVNIETFARENNIWRSQHLKLEETGDLTDVVDR